MTTNTDITDMTTREAFVTKQEVADRYDFTPRWVEYRVREGMPCHKFGRHGTARIRFRLSEVDAWLADNYISAA